MDRGNKGHRNSVTYDALNRRISKKVSGVTTKFVSAGGNVLEEYQSSLIRSFVYGGEIDAPIAMKTSGQTYYYVRDWQANIRLLTDDE